MSTFEITGGVDPLLTVQMQKGDVLFAESNAMVAMDKSLTLTGVARGGVLSSLGRKLLNDENFFQERFEAKEGPGTVLLAPIIPGDVNLLEVGTRTYLISDGAYLASTEGVTLEIKSQGLGKALFARSGGFFLMKATGSGTLVVSGFGSIRALTVTPDKPLVVDNGHVVAWDASLNYDLTINTGIFRKTHRRGCDRRRHCPDVYGNGNGPSLLAKSRRIYRLDCRKPSAREGREKPLKSLSYSP